MTPTNTEALAVRLESGWCPIESPADMERAAAELRRLSAVEAERDALRAEVMEQARCNGMGSEREARLMAERDEVRRERDALMAEIERIKSCQQNR